MNLGELINSTLIKAGLASDSEYLKKILLNAELTKEQVPDEAVSALNSLISVDQAKQHPDVKKHYYGSALSPVEKELASLMAAYEFDADDIDGINQIKSTYSKIPLIKEKIDALMVKKATANKGDGAKYAEEIVKLNKQIADINKAALEKEGYIAAQYEGRILDMQLDGLFNSYNFTEALPKDVAVLSAKQLFNQMAQSKRAKVVNDNGTLKLVNSEDPTLPYMENNQPIELRAFTDKIVADNKLLKVSQGAGGNPNPPNGGGGGNPNPPQGNTNDKSFLQQQMESLAKSRVTV